jgi:hypothetical protein
MQVCTLTSQTGLIIKAVKLSQPVKQKTVILVAMQLVVFQEIQIHDLTCWVLKRI